MRPRRARKGVGRPAQAHGAGRPSPFLRRFAFPFDRWLPRLINSSHLIQLEASIQPELDENLGPRPEGDDGRRKSSKLSRRWLRPSLAAMASLRGCVMVEFMSQLESSMVYTRWWRSKRIYYVSNVFMSSDLFSDHVSPLSISFLLWVRLFLDLFSRQIAWGVLVAMVARSSYRIYPKGVRLASGYPVEKGGVVTGRLHRVGWVSRDRIGGFDLKRLWMRCMLSLLVQLELQLECV